MTNFILLLEIIDKYRILRLIYYIFFISVSAFIISGCSVSKNLKENQYLLSSETVEHNDKISKESLHGLYKIKPNNKVLGTTPYLAIYFFGEKHFDTSKVIKHLKKTEAIYAKKIARIKESKTSSKKKEKLEKKLEKKKKHFANELSKGNWIMRVPGEAPVLYDSAIINQTAKQMTVYLHTHGFFRGNVTTEIDTTGKKVEVKYNIYEGTEYKIKKINYNISDPEVEKLVLDKHKHTLIKDGVRYNESDFTAERERINTVLKDNGYYDFNRQFIFFNLDTADESVVVDVIIKNPKGEHHHDKYYIDKVFFTADVTEIPDKRRDTSIYNGVHYVYYSNWFSKKVLSQKIKLAPGQLYNLTTVEQTHRRLATMDYYKFINISFEKLKSDTATKNWLVAHITTSPLKKSQITDEFGLNMSQNWIPGPFGSISYKQRNIGKGFEIFEASIRYSVIGQAAVSDPNNVLTTEEYGATTSLTFPQLYFPTKLRFKFFDNNPKTKLLASYTKVIRPEYSRANSRVALNYSWSVGKNKQFNFSPVDINLINTDRTTPGFVTYLDDLHALGNNLIYSFGQSLVSDMNFSYTFHNGDFTSNKKSRYLKLYAESGGTTLNLFNKALKRSNDSIDILGNQLRAYEYLKFSADLRYYFPIKKYSSFVVRFDAGAVYAYSKDGILPYERYFFSGGSNSNRAWKPRRLGPGSYAYVDTANGNQKDYKYEEPGEMIFESNFEYRAKLIGVVHWAAFIDAGNTWMIHSDKSRPGSQFHYNQFYKQIAVGSGLGLRLNFSFIILRFDLGIKMYDPSQNEGQRWVVRNISLKTPFGAKEQAVINIGIGYPF